MTSPHIKPAALLRLMAERHGERITQRDCAALHLAAATLDEQGAQLDQLFGGYRDQLHGLVTHKARADALMAGLRALLETHT